MTKDFTPNRKFEFRVWHKETEYMYDNVAVNDEHTVGYESTSKHYNCETSKDIVVLQYTGQKDKQGKKIFEGDILHVSGVDDPVIVWWSDQAVGFVLKNPRATKASEEQVEWPSRRRSLEILGNIFESPELLEEDEEEED